MNKIILLFSFFLAFQKADGFHLNQVKVKDSTEVEKYLKDKRYHFVTAEIVSIKKGKYYLGRWHNFIEEDCFIIKIKVIDKLNSGFRKGQILKIATNGIKDNGFQFKLGEQYFITYMIHTAKINGKYKTLPWTYKDIPTKKLNEAKNEIERIRLAN